MVLNRRLELGRIKRKAEEVPYIAVGVCDTGENTHTGVVHRDIDGTVRFLEQGFHELTRNDPVDSSVQGCEGIFLYGIPDIEADRARNIAGLCRLIAKYLTANNLPGYAYALRFDEDAMFDSVTGRLIMPNGVGLSCSTFVIAVFRSARVRFISFENWPQRTGDIPAQKRLVSVLDGWQRRGIVSKQHVDAVRKEIGCVRARPEELAGICMLNLPGGFPGSEVAGEVVLTMLDQMKRAVRGYGAKIK